jgi:PhnB protein
MAVTLNPYIGFTGGKAREAMEFYHSVFGGELNSSTYGEAGAAHDPSENDHIMHAMIVTDDFTLMAADIPKGMQPKPGKTISISLSGDDEAKLRGYFEKLSAGGQVTVPLDKAPWGDIFGMFTDKYDIDWLVNVNAPKA